MSNKRTSIQRKLTERLLIGLTILSIVASGGTYLFAREAITRQYNAAILAKAKALAALVKQERKRDTLQTEFEYEPGSMPEFERKHHPEYFEILSPDGSAFAKSASLKDAHLSKWKPDNKAEAAFAETKIHGVKERQLTATYWFVPHIEDEPFAPEAKNLKNLMAVTVAQSRKPLDAILSALAGVLLASGILVPLIGAGLIAYTIRRGLRPLGQLANEVQSIRVDNLDKQISLSALPLEIAPVQEKLNQLLQRLHEAFEREKRFTSDVSHELRTPLAEARTAMEVAMRWPYDETLHAKSCADAIEAVDHMEGMVSRLLLLARADASEMRLEKHSTVDLGTITEEAISRVASHERNTYPQIRHAAPANDVQIQTDPILISTIIRNLLDNAVAYAPPDDEIIIKIEQNSDAVHWSIENAAPGLSADDLQKMFQPFWRKDESRSGDAHAGLGLPLVKSLTSAADIQLDSAMINGRLRLTLSFSNVPAPANPLLKSVEPQEAEIPIGIQGA